jgi:hypothetical protein
MAGKDGTQFWRFLGGWFTPEALESKESIAEGSQTVLPLYPLTRSEEGVVVRAPRWLIFWRS